MNVVGWECAQRMIKIECIGEGMLELTCSSLKRGLLATPASMLCIDSTSASASRRLKLDQSKNCKGNRGIKALRQPGQPPKHDCSAGGAFTL